MLFGHASFQILDEPGPPRNLMNETITRTSISIKWETPISDGNSPITNYTVSYKLDNDANPMVYITKNTTINLIGLIPAQKYEINVSANNNHFSGSPSNITVFTAEPGTNLQFSFESFLPSYEDGTYLCWCLFVIYFRDAESEIHEDGLLHICFGKMVFPGTNVIYMNHCYFSSNEIL